VSGSRLNGRIEKAVFAAIEELNEFLPVALRKEKETVLSGALDSLQFVNLVVALEDQLRKEFGLTTILTGQSSDGEAQWASWRTIGDLIQHVASLVEEKTVS
jgi:acyl carrier protein